MSLFTHEFHARCSAGHKRNFEWLSESFEELIAVEDYCPICDHESEYTIRNYWKPVYKE